MDPQNTPFLVQLGQGASIRFANTFINTGNEGATIQFGSFESPAANTTRVAAPARGIPAQGRFIRPQPVNTATAVAPARGMPARGRIVRPQPVNTLARRAVQPVQHSEAAVVEVPQKRTSVPKNNVVTVAEPFAPGRHDAEASSSRGRLSRRQIRKRNAELRAQGLLPPHGSEQTAEMPEANIPTSNKFENLKWVRRNSPTGEIKQSFYNQQRQAPTPAPQPRRTETLSARVHRVLKVAK